MSTRPNRLIRCRISDRKACCCEILDSSILEFETVVVRRDRATTQDLVKPIEVGIYGHFSESTANRQLEPTILAITARGKIPQSETGNVGPADRPAKRPDRLNSNIVKHIMGAMPLPGSQQKTCEHDGGGGNNVLDDRDHRCETDEPTSGCKTDAAPEIIANQRFHRIMTNHDVAPVLSATRAKPTMLTAEWAIILAQTTAKSRQSDSPIIR